MTSLKKAAIFRACLSAQPARRAGSRGWKHTRRPCSMPRYTRQEDREQTEQRQIRADRVDEGNAVRIGKIAEERRTKSPCPEGEAEEDAADQPDAAGDQFLCEDHDRREGRGKHQ